MSRLEQKHNNPLNNSTSKQQYTFPKTNRFKEHFKTQGTDSFYEIPNTRQKIGFSFGKVARYQYNKHENNNQSPPPGSYQLEGDIQKLLKKKQGIRILFGRQQCKSGNLFKSSDNPGPGRYNPNPEVFTKKISREMTLGKVHSSKRLIEEEPLPGPGAYHINSLILNENKVLSKQPKLSYGKIIFPTTRSERMKTQSSPKLRLPEITYKGESVIQKNKGFSISRAQRFHEQFVNENPGPGTYSKFSQFVDLSHR